MKSLARTGAVGALALVVLLDTSPLSARCFQRGDVDGNGSMQVTDAIATLNYLFAKRAEIPCLDAADVNDDGRLNVTDVVHVLQFVLSWPDFPPPWAWPAEPTWCRRDPTPDDLSCEQHGCCSEAFGHVVGSDAEGLFVIIDRSGMMQDNGLLDEARRMVVCTVDEFEDAQQLGVIFVDQGILQFPEDGNPLTTSPEARENVLAWVDSVPAGAGSCIRDGFLLALAMANKATVRPRAIVYLGLGHGFCDGMNEQAYLDETLEVVTEANTDGVTIHAVGFLFVGTLQERFLRALTSGNGGDYVFWTGG